MAELKWPVDNCECGFDLTGTTPKAKDKAFSEDGQKRPMWADFCPKCGRGHVVGERAVPLPQEPGQGKPILKFPSPDQEPEEAKTAPDPDAIPDTMYWCTKCAKRHEKTSGIGVKHQENQEA